MNQTGNKIQGENLQPFLDSAANAAKMGQRQFYTPQNVAKALFTPLTGLNVQAAMDFQCGSGHLLAATGAAERLGLDIDARSADTVGGKHAYVGDCTRWFNLAADARLMADLIVLNPPFSLQWYADRLDGLARSSRPGVPEAFKAATTKDKLIDSTAASLLMALSLLSDPGEGFLVCNAATARRFLGDPAGADPETAKAPLATVRRYLWAWLEIPGVVYDGVQTEFETAVLYFARSHGLHDNGNPPLYLHSPSADPDTIARTLTTALTGRYVLRHGREVKREYDSLAKDTVHKWAAVREEMQRLETPEAKPSWNIWLHPDGTIARNLTTFQKLTVHPQTITLLNDLEGKHPISLVVQTATRAALKTAVESGIWRVHPKVQLAVQQALAEYDSVRAPFFAPNPVQSLGWLDEENSIECSAPGLEGIHPGQHCPVSTWIEDTVWTTKRMSLAGKMEDFTCKGRQLVIKITAPDGTIHQFHVRRDNENKESHKEGDKWKHDQTKILAHFHVPCPKDIAQLHPERFKAKLDRLKVIEAHIAARMLSLYRSAA